MIASHLPVLQVAVPLMAAPVCVLLRRGSLAWAFTTVICWGLLAIAAMLLDQVMSTGPISYRLGGWAPPFGIEYRLDGVNTFVLFIIAGIAALMMPYARASVAHEIAPERQHLFYAMFLLALTGLLGIVATGDAFNIYVFLEISSLATYVLIALGQKRRALAAAYQYLIIGTIGASFILIGIGLLYAKTGTLNLADLSARVPALGETPAVLSAFAFITVGVLIKLALFPFHVWLPNAYAYAPSFVTAFLAATATKVGAYVLLRFIFTVFGAQFAFGSLPLTEILLALSLVAVLVGSLVAVFQTDLKRLLAFSSVGQIGYLGVGIGLASVNGVTGALVHIFNHALMKGGLFLAVGAIAFRLGATDIKALHGLGRRMPFTMAAIVIGGLGLVGVPVTSGFVSKWYLVQAAIEADLWPVAMLILVGSLIALAYVGRLIEAAYFHAPPPGTERIREAPWPMQLAIWLLIAGSLYFGLDTDLTVGVAERAATELLGSTP
jgi:multicomponent Na+:H+ antiporter subunit D